MLYDSTKVLLRGLVKSLESGGPVLWEDHVEWGGECLYEIHQMARPLYQGYRTDPSQRTAVLVPVYERASRAIPHLKCMVRAVRSKNQAVALASVKAALAEM